MKSTITLLLLALLGSACQPRTETKAYTGELCLLPTPKQLKASNELLLLAAESKLFSPDESVQPLLSLFQEELERLTGKTMEITTEKRQADVNWELDPQLAKEAYHLSITDQVQITGGSYQALSQAKTTLLQLSTVEADRIAFPVVQIQDQAETSFRGLMIDLARNWHSLDNVKQLIDLAAFYKSNYVHLHFTDYQSYTLPSTVFPKLSTPGRSYSQADLAELEAYAQLRGITIIPEIDIPGHSSPFVEQYPEIFAIEAVAENPYIINMGKEAVYEALDKILGELAQAFPSSPYLHIGGDEAYFLKVMEDPQVQAYMQQHELGDDVHELYRHFLIRMNEIVKKHGKQMAVWEGFRREGALKIPKDILVFEFETNRYLPHHLVEDGYTVVNTSWKPLYVVNQKKWEPKTIYQWNLYRWENWWSKAPSIDPIQLEPSPLVVGAEMCSWEQAAEKEVPSLRMRLPVMNERIWHLEPEVSYSTFMEKLLETDRRLSLLIGENTQDSLLLNYNFNEAMLNP